MPQIASRTAPVILVEDNPDDVLLILHAFKRVGMTNPVETISDGEAAIAHLSGPAARAEVEAPAVVLLDLKLPRRSGLEVLQAVRSDARTRLWPIVVLTSSGESSDVRRAYELGANSYLVKPVASTDLLDLVATINRYWIALNVHAR